jgi:hypothetical protein
MENNNQDVKLENIIDNKKVTYWTDHDEALLKIWYDHAQVYEKLHLAGFNMFQLIDQGINIPIIILSSITGTGNFALEQVSIDYRSIASMILGGIGMVVVILAALYRFFKVGEIMGKHEYYSKQWGNLYMDIQTQLTRERPERIKKEDFIDLIKKKYDQLKESSPALPEKIIKEFMKDLKLAEEYNMPNITTELSDLIINKNETYINRNEKIIKEKTEEFVRLQGRKPTQEELEDYLRIDNII